MCFKSREIRAKLGALEGSAGHDPPAFDDCNQPVSCLRRVFLHGTRGPQNLNIGLGGGSQTKV